MSGFAAYTLAAVLAQALQVRLAPDQPAPIFFTDEPLVVQFESIEPVSASAEVAVTLPNGERTAWSADGLVLTPNQPTWHAITSLPVVRGPHAFRVAGGAGEFRTEFHQSISRIDRPPSASAGLTGVHLYNASPAILYAMRCLPVAFVRLDIDTPKVADLVRSARQNTPGRLYLRVPPGDATDRLDLAKLAGEIGSLVDVWEIAGAEEAAGFAMIASDIRRGAPEAKLAARVSAAREAIPLLRAEPNARPDRLVVAPDAVVAVEQATERAGIEGISLIVEFNPALGPDADTAALVPRLLEVARSPHHEVVVPQRLFETPAGFSGALSVFASATRLFEGAEYLGPIDLEGNNRAWLYSRPGDVQPPEWIAAVVYTDPNEPVPVLPDAGVQSWTMTDAYGNVRAASGEPGTGIGTPPGFGLWFVRGSGGAVVLEAHLQRLKSYATLTLPHEAALTAIAPDAIAAVQLLRNYSYPAPTRLQFFNIVRALPMIEEAWHRGIIEPRDAVPLSRHFAAIARELASIKQEAGEQFLEPLERTFANCRQFLNAYPAALDDADAQRVAFLRAEVARLIDVARACEDAGRIIEAKGVAALAEWRARSLESAATIPVLDPDEEPPHEGEAEAAVDDGGGDEEPASDEPSNETGGEEPSEVEP